MPAYSSMLNVTASPSHTGAFETITGCVIEFVTSTSTLAASEIHPFSSVTITVYVPLFNSVTFTKTGSSFVETKAFGPVHA